MRLTRIIFGAFVALSAGSVIGLAASERVASVPAGTYTFAQIITQSGTATSPIRYRPATPGTVTIRGGEIKNVQHVILDGFIIDSRLSLDMPTKAFGVDIWSSSDVEITNSVVIGPNDIHTGFNVLGDTDCQESTGALKASVGITSRSDSHRITFSNLVVHGFYGAGSLRGTDDRVVNSLFRNSFNGFGISADKVTIRDSVFWVHPNHLFSIQGAGSVEIVNNLIVDAQDMVQAGPNWEGAQRMSIIHNTFWVPANKPCYGLSGITLHKVPQSAVVRDNLLVNKSNDKWIQAGPTTVPVLQSDYNGFAHYTSTTKEFKLWNTDGSSVEVTLEEWRNRTGQDRHSPRLMPTFVDPPRYEDFSANKWGFRIPRSAAEARSWLTLRSDSPGKQMASDGSDLGIGPVGSYTTPTLTPTLPQAPKNLRLVP